MSGTTSQTEAVGGVCIAEQIDGINIDSSVYGSRHTYILAKRSVDCIVASTAIVVALPILAIIAVIVKLTSPGPLLFRQRRLGQGGTVFWCYKFRTMVKDAESQLKSNPVLSEQFNLNFKLKSDPRITPVGAFLRKTSLDEIPQFFNVIKGDISLIGPRPIVENEIAKYGVYGTKLLSVKPGLSGWWQVYGRSNTSYDQRIVMDMQYIDGCNLLLDLKLMVLTALAVIRGRGAY